jgi:hypothetical protein
MLGLASAAVTGSAAETARSPVPFQTATKCVALWNDASPPARRSAVARLRPIMAMVAGAGVPRIDATPRCGVMVMASNGSWYATQTSSLAHAKVTWSPLTRLADAGTAQSYNLSNGDPRIVRFAHALPTGMLRLN